MFNRSCMSGSNDKACDDFWKAKLRKKFAIKSHSELLQLMNTHSTSLNW